MQEDELLAEIEKRCGLRGLLWHHSRDSRREQSGWPDLVIVGPGGILFRELKSEDGRLSLAQRDVGRTILAARGNWAIWRPSDLYDGTVSRWLTKLVTQ